MYGITGPHKLSLDDVTCEEEIQIPTRLWKETDWTQSEWSLLR